MSSISQLTSLLSTTSYRLAYVLPLLLLSILLTFAGTFLTLDRSRSFPSTDSAVTSGKGYAALPLPGALSFDKPKKRRGLNWVLEGGIGGLAGGYAFGVHLSTALALLIPATTTSAPLSFKSFLAVWILSCIVTTPLAGRYRYVALAFFGVSGGTLTALALCIITHPSLPSRIILVSTFLPLFTVLVLLTSTIPIPRITTTVFHPLLRLCTASTGAFGVVMSIALLMNPKEEGWANAWERLWMTDGPLEGSTWGSGQEQGLSAAYAVFLFVGMATDWALRRWIGECPDEKWDNYLAHYAANLPNQADRAGSFQPLTTFWDRVFPSSTLTPPFSKEILFPSDADMKSKVSLPLPATMHNVSPGKLSKVERGLELTRVPTSVELLKKRRSKARPGVGWKERGRKERKPVRFGELSDDSDSDDELDEDPTKKASNSWSPVAASPIIEEKKRLWTVTNAQHSASSSSTPTLVGNKHISSDPRLEVLDTLDYDQEIAQLKQQRKTVGGGDEGEELDYSDYEEDLTTRRPIFGKAEEGAIEGAGWSPAFLKRHQSQNLGEQAMPMPMPVPATPSLIKAIDRLAIAQREAFGAAAGAVPPARTSTDRTAPVRSASSTPQGHAKRRLASGTPSPEDAEAGNIGGTKETPFKKAERAPRWEEFWREVRVKALS